MNPMVNRFQEKIELPASCVADKQVHSSLIQSEGTISTDDLWMLWPRQGVEINADQIPWWIPNARHWMSLEKSARSGSSGGTHSWGNSSLTSGSNMDVVAAEPQKN